MIADPEDRWPETGRLDNTLAFECSHCGRLTDAIDGGCPDDVDVDGTLCSACWCAAADVRGLG